MTEGLIPPYFDAAASAIESHLWPGLFTCHLVRHDGGYYAVTAAADGGDARAEPMPGEAAAREYLLAYRARLILARRRPAGSSGLLSGGLRSQPLTCAIVRSWREPAAHGQRWAMSCAGSARVSGGTRPPPPTWPA
jgi:hypothetical protein